MSSNRARSPHPPISVAMAIFNGSGFLREQLESIAKQDLLPTELVISDDGSSDASPEIARDFAKVAPFPVSVRVNPHNVGVSRNFEYAIRACRGPIVALADQDDVWLPHKLSTAAARLAGSDQPGLVFSDATVVDEHLRPLRRSLFTRVGFSALERRMFSRGRASDVLLRHNVVTGATVVFRSRLVKLALPFPAGWVHDAWLGLVASLVGGAAWIGEPLLLYRQHGGNVIGVGETLAQKLQVDANDYFANLEASVEGWDRALDLAGEVAPRAVPLLQRKKEHILARASLPRERARRVPVIVRALLRGEYHRFARGGKTAFRDIVIG